MKQIGMQCNAKFMEKIVKARLVNYLESNDVLSPYQYGFLKMRSAPDSFFRLSSDIIEAFSRREQLVCVFSSMLFMTDANCKRRYMTYFILSVPIYKCLGKYSCMRSTFPAVLNGTCFFR